MFAMGIHLTIIILYCHIDSTRPYHRLGHRPSYVYAWARLKEIEERSSPRPIPDWWYYLVAQTIDPRHVRVHVSEPGLARVYGEGGTHGMGRYRHCPFLLGRLEERDSTMGTDLNVMALPC